MSNAELRKKLIEEINRQGKPFGLLIDDIAGGFTFTGRGQPQAFQVQPLVVYKVFADGRPDELVRGVDIVGTPLVSLTKIVATGDTMETFNGYCGAESGSVPVSASAPAILMTRNGSAEEGNFHRQAAHFAAARRMIHRRCANEPHRWKIDEERLILSKRARGRYRHAQCFAADVRRTCQRRAAAPSRNADRHIGAARCAGGAADSDHKTLAAMQDELDRARTRLELKIPGTNEPARPYLHPVPRARSRCAHDCRGIRRAGFLAPPAATAS